MRSQLCLGRTDETELTEVQNSDGSGGEFHLSGSSESFYISAAEKYVPAVFVFTDLNMEELLAHKILCKREKGVADKNT